MRCEKNRFNLQFSSLTADYADFTDAILDSRSWILDVRYLLPTTPITALLWLSTCRECKHFHALLPFLSLRERIKVRVDSIPSVRLGS